MNYIKGFNYIVNMIWDILHLKRIALNVWLGEKHKNWGDDLNLHLLKLITGKYIYVANKSLLHRFFKIKNYSCIGSILGMFEDEKTEIWGAGFISESTTLRQTPFKIHSVRGKLTRAKLLEQGVDCPENYGDPALLVSRFYKAKPIGKYKIGIIPHYVDWGIGYIREFASNHKEVLLIDVAHYEKWTDICDMIVSCDLVISSSLHGLIVSDSYGIPNNWVEFSDKVVGNGFKFLDYFSSVMRPETSPLIIQNESQLELLLYKSAVPPSCAQIDFDVILDTCPFR